jgi:hypothetical protein
MIQEKHITTVKTIKSIAWFVLLLLGLLVFVFALISGNEDIGLLKNSANTLLWVALLSVTIYAWKKPVFGGFTVILIGLVMVYLFNFNGKNFFLSTFILTLVIPLLGFIILICGYYLDNLPDPPHETQ